MEVQHRALIVDDNNDNREIFRIVLESVGYTAYEATNGVAAMSMLQKGNFELMLLDMQMPQMDGRAVLNDACPILVTTAFYTTDSIGELTSNGFEACLLKPIEPRSLFQVLVAYINGAGDDGSISSATSPA